MSKAEKIEAILAAQQVAYEAEGVEGDFDDARRWYQKDASDYEINNDYATWCKQM